MKFLPKYFPVLVSGAVLFSACSKDAVKELIYADVERQTTVEAGDAYCPAGGTKIEFGLDENSNKILDDEEVNELKSKYICSAQNGLSTIIEASVLEAGDSKCPAGGTLLKTGLDKNSDGKLSEDEITNNTYTCNGESAQSQLVTTTTVTSANECSGSATRIDSGLDINSNSILDTNEITTTSYICDGENGITSLVEQVKIGVGHSECPDGGIELKTGLDLNGNGKLDDDENPTIGHICEWKITTLTTTGSEPAGTNCPYGGVFIAQGDDSNYNGMLDSSEINSALTQYACNGEPAPVQSYPPVVNAIYSNPGIAQVGNSITISADVFDQDDLVESYTWYDYNNTEIQNSADVTLNTIAPSAIGSYQYTLIAQDTAGNKTKATVVVDVVETTQIEPARPITIGVGDTQYFIPPGMDRYGLSGDINGSLLVGGTHQELMGVVADRGNIFSSTDVDSAVKKIANTLNLKVGTLSGISESKFNLENTSTEVITSEYKLALSNKQTPLNVIQSVMEQVAVNKAGGVVNNSLQADTNAPSTKEYRLKLTTIYYSQNKISIALALIPESEYINLASALNAAVEVSNFSDNDKIVKNTQDDFSAKDASGSKADFLFVIDNSGSMYDDQLAVSEAASSFAKALEGTAIDYHIGIITTDSSTIRGGTFIDNNITTFENNVKVGTNGSWIETGIYYAEEALQSKAKGDSNDGSVTLAGYPRADSKLSVIILSDEPSQYTSRSSGTAFDTKNNIFVNRNYSVYAILNRNDDSSSQYDDLANATGGSLADISSTSSFGAIMTKIGDAAGSAAAGYELKNTPIVSSIKVIVNGVEVTRGVTNGWSYDQASNKISFRGSAIPTLGETINIAYSYATSRILNSITLNVPATVFSEGNNVQLSAIGNYEGDIPGNLSSPIWSSSDTTVATVDQNSGLVTMQKNGNVTITIKQGDVNQSVDLNVVAAIDNLEISIDKTEISVGDTAQLTFKANLTDGSSKDFSKPTWSSSDTSVVTVDSNGVITLQATGKVTITATDEGGFSATKEFTF